MEGEAVVAGVGERDLLEDDLGSAAPKRCAREGRCGGAFAHRRGDEERGRRRAGGRRAPSAPPPQLRVSCFRGWLAASRAMKKAVISPAVAAPTGRAKLRRGRRRRARREGGARRPATHRALKRSMRKPAWRRSLSRARMRLGLAPFFGGRHDLADPGDHLFQAAQELGLLGLECRRSPAHPPPEAPARRKRTGRTMSTKRARSQSFQIMKAARKAIMVRWRPRPRTDSRKSVLIWAVSLTM